MSEEEGAPKRGSRSARRAPEDRRGLLYWLGDLFANKGKELFAGFVITVFGVVTYAMWDTLQDKTRGFVVEAVLAEFDERNRLTEPIYKILQQDKAKGLSPRPFSPNWNATTEDSTAPSRRFSKVRVKLRLAL